VRRGALSTRRCRIRPEEVLDVVRADVRKSWRVEESDPRSRVAEEGSSEGAQRCAKVREGALYAGS